MTLDGPCRDCKDRWIDFENMTRCHQTCGKYLDFKMTIAAATKLEAIERVPKAKAESPYTRTLNPKRPRFKDHI